MNTSPVTSVAAVEPIASESGFIRGLGLFDSTMIVVGSMIGSGIFIVSADISRSVGSRLWLLLAWIAAGVITLLGALSYGELAAMYPRAGGQYVFLRESMGPLGFSVWLDAFSRHTDRDDRRGGSGICALSWRPDSLRFSRVVDRGAGTCLRKVCI